MTAPTVRCTSTLPTAHETTRHQPSSAPAGAKRSPSKRVDPPGVARADHGGDPLALGTADS